MAEPNPMTVIADCIEKSEATTDPELIGDYIAEALGLLQIDETEDDAFGMLGGAIVDAVADDPAHTVLFEVWSQLQKQRQRPSPSPERHATGGMAMKFPQTGGCQCGKIRYEITETPQLVYTCHCKDCQRLTSSAFSIGIVVAESAFHRSGVEPRPLQRMADSGRTNTRWVCPECGSWVASPPRDGVIRVRAGTLDDTSWLRPTRHIWTRSKQPWVVFGAGDETFEKAPPP